MLVSACQSSSSATPSLLLERECWSAGFVLFRFGCCLSHRNVAFTVLSKRSRVLQAGTGLLGIVIQHLGADAVLCTEYFRCVEWLQKNVSVNMSMPGMVLCVTY